MVRAEVEWLAEARLGRRLDEVWCLQEVIGIGGTAAVYRGVHDDGRVGAVKVMHAHLLGERTWVRRLRREASLLDALSHPGLVRLLDVGETDDGAPFLVTELLAGRSLEVLRRDRGGALPARDVVGYATELLHVLAYTHARKVLHRDLKPSNVFVTAANSVKVLDFGIGTAALGPQGDSGQTATRGILGTPAYMAPEQARGRWDLVDERSDLWSVGALLFTLLSGQYVHLATTENERLGLAMCRSARPLASVAPWLAPPLARVVDRALAYEARERFQTAEEFLRALCEKGVLAAAVTETALGAEATLYEVAHDLEPSPLGGSRKWRFRSQLLVGGLMGLSGLAAVSIWRGAQPVAPDAPAANRARSANDVAARASASMVDAPAARSPAAQPKPSGGQSTVPLAAPMPPRSPAKPRPAVASAVLPQASQHTAGTANQAVTRPPAELLDERVIESEPRHVAELLERRE